MTEMIGKVRLDYSKYSGEDDKSRSEADKELLEVVSNYPASEFPRIIEEKKSGYVLYHLSPLRENIAEWIPIEGHEKVLEIGSQCGAITGLLSRRAGTVTCVDDSQIHSRINAHRNKECENITIRVGNFMDIVPSLEKDFDYIFLIGSFKLAQSYVGGTAPFEDCLSLLKKHLAPKGRIIIGIENKYGLKYFAGSKEDHLGTFFGGIENYTRGGEVRTFSRNGLEKIFERCGFKKFSFFYPYPDYQFMTALYSDSRQPGRGELYSNLRNFDKSRMVLFDEKQAFDGMVEDGLFPVFSNSYLAVIGDDFPVHFVKYSNDRAAEYAIRTQIGRERGRGIHVRKYPLTEEAGEHVKAMALAYEGLVKRYAGGKLSINKCTLFEKEGRPLAQFEHIKGVPLSELMDKCLEENNPEGFYMLFREYRERIGYGEEQPVADYDMIFSNILVDGEDWTLIDYEWTFGRQISVKELAFRAIWCYLLEDKKREKINLDYILEELSITPQEGEHYKELERDFQSFVTGKRCSMATLRDLVGNPLLCPKEGREGIYCSREEEEAERVQIYEDRGEGYKEENSYFISQAYDKNNQMEIEIGVSREVINLRIDPFGDTCLIKICALTFNGEPIPLKKGKVITTNGKILKGKRKGQEADGLSIIFPTTDPNICISMKHLSVKEENLLYARIEALRLPEEASKEVAAAVKEPF